MQAQIGACDVQIVIDGLATPESSNVPARTKIRCGRASASLNICVPHFGQNRRCMTLPLSATLRKSASSPSIVIAEVEKHTFTVAEPAARYWHTRHQQIRVVIGAAAIR